MKVYITSIFEFSNANRCAVNLLDSFKNDPFKRHKVVENPQDADIILFAENHPGSDPYFFKVLKSNLFKKYKDKCILYHDNDHHLTFLPTISPSLEKSYYDPVIGRPFPYIIQLSRNIYIDDVTPVIERKYLFSFIGSGNNHPVRKKVLAIQYNRSILTDTSGLNLWELQDNDKNAYFKKYADVSLNSKFIICPRGIGPSTYRLYESLKLGIAPIIISDEWIPPLGPDWQKISIIIKESEVGNLVDILEKAEPRYAEMGLLARKAWEEFYADDKHFHYLVETCIELQQYSPKERENAFAKQKARFLAPFHFRNLLRYHYKKFRKRLKNQLA